MSRLVVSRRLLAVLDLVLAFDFSADAGDVSLEVDENEFYRGMRTKCNYRGDLATLQRVYRTLDSDASGSIGYDDFFEFVRGRPCAEAEPPTPLSGCLGC